MKQNKQKIAVTGGIGSGKSSVMQIIAELGYPVFSADAFARTIYEEEAVFRKVAEQFPGCIAGGQVDRKKLADAVFHDRTKLSLLDQITHPAIMQKMFSQMDACSGPVFAEVPLLFEGAYEKDFDHVIVVLRGLDARIRSVCARDNVTRDEVLARIKNQYDYENNPLNGHTVIYNDGSLSSLRQQVVCALQKIVR